MPRKPNCSAGFKRAVFGTRLVLSTACMRPPETRGIHWAAADKMGEQRIRNSRVALVRFAPDLMALELCANDRKI
jgi:hypothetical protein